MSSNTTVPTTGPNTSIPGITTSIPITTTTAAVSTTSAVTTTPSTTSAAGDTTSVVSATTPPPSTQLITSVVTQTPSAGGSSVPPVTVTLTSSITPSNTRTTTGTSSSTSPTSSTALQNGGSTSSGGGGLTAGGRTAIAVVVPVVAVALIVLALLFFWRRRKQRKTAAEARRQEVEEYGFNPNNDPTIPAIAADGRSEMTEDRSGGYRGWGVASTRKPSTTMSGGHTRGQLSDAGSNNGALSTSATAVGGSDGHASDGYSRPQDAFSSDDVAALGAAPVAGANRDGIRRGPSNASSSYSAGHRSEHSDPSINQHPMPDPVSPQNYGYGQHGPYGDGSYGGGDGMPVVRDVSARRNTKIEQGGGYAQGNSGISQNF